MKQAVLIFMLIAKVCFSQCVNTEKQYEEKKSEMLEQCKKMERAVPCEVGFSPDNSPSENEAKNQADDDAMIKLAKNIGVFIEQYSKDSIYTKSDFYKDKDVAKRLGESVSKVGVKQRLENTKSPRRECFSFTKDGKTFYRGASLRVYAEFYDEWERKKEKQERNIYLEEIKGERAQTISHKLKEVFTNNKCRIEDKPNDNSFTIKIYDVKDCNFKNDKYDFHYCSTCANIEVIDGKSKKGGSYASIEKKADGNDRETACEKAAKVAAPAEIWNKIKDKIKEACE